VVVFDVTERESFENACQWVHQRAQAQTERKWVLVGNKCDVGTEPSGEPRVPHEATGLARVVPHEEALQFAHENDIDYFEVSAKDDIGIRECLFVLSGQVLAEQGGRWLTQEVSQQHLQDMHIPKWNAVGNQYT
jgi:GTPase SAR1 family protein